MRITQPDSRTIRVVTDGGVSFFLPYRLSWNGHDREPASVVLETAGSGAKESAEVKAFFLFGMVRDRITADAAGITIARSWNLMTPGSVKILLDVEFEAPSDPVCLFPGVHAARGLPTRTVSFLGERTSYPAALVAGLGSEAAVIFSRFASCGGDPSSIGISREDREDEPARLRVEVRFPGIEEPGSRTGPKPEHSVQPEDAAIQCSGSLERSHELFLAFSPREEILAAAPAAVLKRLRTGALPKLRSAPDLSALSQAAQGVLSTHLVEEGGVAGLREVPGSPWISSFAGLALAVTLRKLFQRDEKTGEIALRLADFALKGQLPSGLFYESYDLDAGEWRGVRGRPGRAMISVAHGARIADLLLMLAEDLDGQGLPFEKYFLAGQRFVDFFVDERGRCALPGGILSPGQPPAFDETGREGHSRSSATDAGDMGAWELFFPLARVLDRQGRDRYKKALDVIARRFAAAPWDIFQPPSSRGGRDADSAGSLLAARLFVEMRRRGYRPAEPLASGALAARARAAESTRLFASLLVPWIRVHAEEERRQGQPGLDGALVDSFARQRVVFAGIETAYVLQGLGGLAGQRELKSLLDGLSRLCLASGRDVPLGTAFFQHTRWDEEGRVETGSAKAGPVDSRRLARELLFGLLASSGRKTKAPSSSRPSAAGKRRSSARASK